MVVIFEPYFRDICGLSEAIRELEKNTFRPGTIPEEGTDEPTNQCAGV